MLRLRDILYSIYSTNTGQTVQRIADDCERNKWLGAQEMIDYGLCDKILEHLPETIKATKDPEA